MINTYDIDSFKFNKFAMKLKVLITLNQNAT